MNYDNPALIDRLAAEHVLGTLRGAARRRFSRLCDTNQNALRAVQKWEDDLSALTRTLERVQPSARVWQRISAQLYFKSASRKARRRAWSFAIAAGLLAIGVMVSVFVRQSPTVLPPLAVLGTDAAHPVWRIGRGKESAALSIDVVGAIEHRPGKAYELWALPRGGNPVSLGLLPGAGSLKRALNDRQRVALLAADKVAVSVEPELGSPTGSPTGPVILVAAVSGSG